MQCLSQKRSSEFTLACCLFVAAAALFAATNAIALKVAAVFLMAGPHNWIEFRYCLSRLPIQWKDSSRFFVSSFIGLGLLSAGFIGLQWIGLASIVAADTFRTICSSWSVAFVCWVGVLCAMRGYAPLRLLVPACAACATFGWFMPQWFSLALVYAHPVMSLWILDAELVRTRPELVRSYRLALSAVPLVLLAYWYCMANQAFAFNGAVAEHVVAQSGGAMLGPHLAFFISALVFLDLLHYGVWLLAIPTTAGGWSNWRPRAFPLQAHSTQAAMAVTIALSISTLAVFLLWASFSVDYVITSRIYFTVAVVHVLAEVPLLLWLRKCV